MPPRACILPREMEAGNWVSAQTVDALGLVQGPQETSRQDAGPPKQGGGPAGSPGGGGGFLHVVLVCPAASS